MEDKTMTTDAAKALETPYGELICEHCGSTIECNEFGDMPHKCKNCGAILDYSAFWADA